MKNIFAAPYKDLVNRHGLTLIPLKPGTKAPKIRGYQHGKGITRSNFEKDFKPHLSYAACPHFARLAVIDIDRTTHHSKAALAGMSVSEAQELMSEYLLDLYKDHSWMLDKQIHMNWSGSGRGLHLWFNRPEPSLGRPKFACGDIFDGSNYVALYDPAGLLKALEKDLASPRLPLETYELKALVADYEAEAAEKGVVLTTVRQPKSVDAPPLTADDLVSVLGTGPGFGAQNALSLVEYAVKHHTQNFSDTQVAMQCLVTPAGAEFPWSPLSIASKLGRIPPHYWDDYHWWLWSGMALHDLNDEPAIRQLMFDVWTQFSQMSAKFVTMDQYNVWTYFKSSREIGLRARTMGTICYVAGQQDYPVREPVDVTPALEWAAGHIIKINDVKAFVSHKAMREAYVKSGGAMKPRMFSKVVAKYLDEQGYERSARRGQRGFKGVKIK